MIPDRLKKIIFRKLYDDLSHVEIISFRNSIWFIDREEKFWYFELQSDGTLWWRYQFFSDFFILFSLERDDYQSILARWVEEVLNSRVYTTRRFHDLQKHRVEEVLNSKVHTTFSGVIQSNSEVEEVLNFRVHTTGHTLSEGFGRVEEALNSRVNTTHGYELKRGGLVEEALNSRVNTTPFDMAVQTAEVEEVLNSRVNTTVAMNFRQEPTVEEVLNCGDNAPTIGERLNHKVSQAKEGELKDETIVDTILSSLRSF